ncbi:MAG: hypothetical protein KJ574_04265 [Nanoarchaeota archaeon]|nr:hypothetical protein [Nanoarchaeota archaeon]
MDSDTPPKPDQLKEVFANIVHILKDQGLTPQEMMDIYQGPQPSPDKQFVPVGIFAGKLSPSESLCKYLKENLSLSYKEIARLLNRDERSIWTSHHRANKKMPESYSAEKLKNSRMIPIEIFANRGLSVLENLVIYLKEQTGGTNYQTAKLLNKTPSMIYTIYNRAKSKLDAAKLKQTKLVEAPREKGKKETKRSPKKEPVKKEKREQEKKVPVKRKRLSIRDYI